MTTARGPALSDLSARTLRSRQVVTFRSILLLFAAALPLAGCAKKSAHEPSAPEAATRPDDIDRIEQELASREAQLRAIGIARPAPLEARAPASEAAEVAGAGGGGDAAEAPRRDQEKSAAADMAPTQAAPASASGGPSPRRTSYCETICDLSASICQLQDHICGLAPRHPDEPRYQAACERAAVDCQLSTEACHACR